MIGYKFFEALHIFLFSVYDGNDGGNQIVQSNVTARNT